MLDDAKLVGATKLSHVRIGLNSNEAFSEFQVSEPTPLTSSGERCAMSVVRASGGFLVKCAVVGHVGVFVNNINPDALQRIWHAEGSPTDGWELQLDTVEEPVWRAIKGSVANTYSLDGTAR